MPKYVKFILLAVAMLVTGFGSFFMTTSFAPGDPVLFGANDSSEVTTELDIDLICAVISSLLAGLVPIMAQHCPKVLAALRKALLGDKSAEVLSALDAQAKTLDEIKDFLKPKDNPAPGPIP